MRDRIAATLGGTPGATVVRPASLKTRRTVDARRGWRPAGSVLLGLLLLPTAGGCTLLRMPASARGWWMDIDTAEHAAAKRGAPMLVYYHQPRPGERDPLELLLKDRNLRRKFKEYVRCRLYHAYEPDRRYAAQFGVQFAPSWIVVHPDGTYHALTRTASADELKGFLERAVPPGQPPRLNPHIPRKARYAWHKDLGAAQAAAQRSGRPLLIVYHRALTRDWRKLTDLLERHEVYSRVADMVHCRVTALNPWARAYISGYGVLQLPALVVVRPDGGYRALEQPTSLEVMARFVDETGKAPAEAQALFAPAAPTGGAAASSGGSH
ncbi:MAG: hypothetical protein HY763_09655 [Planctomycetes bacterium]|nr:hypothetical protein [Planctomycetota bacterium]